MHDGLPNVDSSQEYGVHEIPEADTAVRRPSDQLEGIMGAQDGTGDSVRHRVISIGQVRLGMTEGGHDLAGGGRVDLHGRSTDGEKVSVKVLDAIRDAPE